jgi:hypothetical protein
MIRASVRRHVPVGWRGGARAVVDAFASRHVFEASEAEREEIARRADAFLAMPSPDADEVRARAFDLLTGDWKTRAEAAAALDASAAWTSWERAGSLGCAAEGGRLDRDDAKVALAALIAAREVLRPEAVRMHEALTGSARAAAAHERDGAALWDGAARPLASELAGHARTRGHGRLAAALAALAAAMHLKGRALAAAAPADPFLLGAAASALLRDAPKRVPSSVARLRSLVARVASLNAARAALWGVLDAEAARRMGAAAAFAVFGKGSVAFPAASARARPDAALRLCAATVGRLAHLTAAEAAARLDEEAADPRVDAALRRRHETLASALRRRADAHAIACAEAAGIEPPDVRLGAFAPGMRTYIAAPGGRSRALTAAGKRGRPVRCRAVAGADGAHVGYLAYDALSREFGGRPLYAAYAHDGSRYGYAWADEGRPVIRLGEPEQGFMTAPARIPL